MNAHEVTAKRGFAGLRFEAVNSIQFVRPLHVAGVEVPLKTAQGGEALGLGQLAFALGELLLRLLAVRDFLRQARVDRREFAVTALGGVVELLQPIKGVAKSAMRRLEGR